MRRENSTVLVTGGSKGVGRALAIGFSREGWQVAIVSRNEEGLTQTYERLQTHSKGHFFQPCDITVWSDCLHIADQIKEQFGFLNVLINNAFGYGEESILKMGPGEIHDLFETSITGTVLISKALIKYLEKGFKVSGEKSMIINIVADWGFPMHNIFTGTSAYVAAKYAIHGLGVSLHKELAPLGINVTNIYPGIIASGFDLDDGLDKVKKEYGNKAIFLKDLVKIIINCTQLESSVIRHLVISPDNPKYDGL